MRVKSEIQAVSKFVGLMSAGVLSTFKGRACVLTFHHLEIRARVDHAAYLGKHSDLTNHVIMTTLQLDSEQLSRD